MSTGVKDSGFPVGMEVAPIYLANPLPSPNCPEYEIKAFVTYVGLCPKCFDLDLLPFELGVWIKSNTRSATTRFSVLHSEILELSVAIDHSFALTLTLCHRFKPHQCLWMMSASMGVKKVQLPC